MQIIEARLRLPVVSVVNVEVMTLAEGQMILHLRLRLPQMLTLHLRLRQRVPPVSGTAGRADNSDDSRSRKQYERQRSYYTYTYGGA